MSHNVETMMYVNQPAWHGLGTRLHDHATSAEAMQAAGLDWGVELAPLLASPSPETAGGNLRTVERYRAVVRTTDGKPLGVVGKRYVPVQNADTFAAFDQLAQTGEITYETAGALDGGRRIWVLAKLPGQIIEVAPDDATECYLLLVNSHDGSGALRILFTPTRVVCQNTLALALHAGQRHGAAVRHTASAPQRIKEAQATLMLAHAYYEDFAHIARRLVETPCDDRDLTRLLDALLPVDPAEPAPRTVKARENILALFTIGEAQRGIRGTAWAALNAVVEFVDHHRPTRGKDQVGRNEARLASAWFGTGAALKQRAYDAIPLLLTA